MSDIQRIIDATSPVLEAWDLLPDKPVDDDFWTHVAPVALGVIAEHSLHQHDFTLDNAVMLLNLCERRLRGVDVDDMIASVNNRVRAAGSIIDEIRKHTEGEQK